MNRISTLVATTFGLALTSVTLGACDPDAGAGPGGPWALEDLGDRDLFVWIGADRDAVVRCSGAECSDGDVSYGLEGSLAISNEPGEAKASYVHFHLPELPPGAEVVEAYLELHHGATREDGRSDDRCLPVAPAASAWTWTELTWNGQPNTIGLGAGGPFAIALRSDAWSGTGDIGEHVADLMGGTAPNHGFAVFAPGAAGGPVDKGFESTNGASRAADDLGLAPRLLVRVHVPDGVEGDFVVPPLPPDNDLQFDGQTTALGRVSAGDDWPEIWHASIDTPGSSCS